MNEFNHVSGKFHNVNGANIYYETRGNKNGPVLLLLHGGFGSIEDFNTLLPALAADHYIIGVDSRGQGKSTMGTQKLSYELIRHDVEGLLNYLNIKKLSIMGFSDGGIAAYRLAAFSNLEIEKLITIGSRWQLSDALRTRELFLKITPESWKNKFLWTYDLYQKLNSEPDFDKLTKEIISMWLDEGPSGYPNICLKNFEGATLIVRGDADHLVTLTSLAELAGILKNALLLNIPFAGHAAFIDQPEIFKIALQQFLER